MMNTSKIITATSGKLWELETMYASQHKKHITRVLMQLQGLDGARQLSIASRHGP